MSDVGGDGDWCTIESDPGVFTEMLESLGCSAVELEELWSLDDDSLQRLGSGVLGLIFLFQWMSDPNEASNTSTTNNNNNSSNDEAGAATVSSPKQPLSEEEIPPNVFFAHQVVTNACATQAIVSVVFNAGLSTDELGPILSEFQNFTSSFPPQLKGVAIGSSDDIRKCHNAFGRPDAFLNDEKLHVPTGNEEAFHFISYVPVDSTLYELDGLKSGPVVVGTFDKDENSHSFPSWLSLARSAIQERMQAGGENIKFNLMAVMRDQRATLQDQLSTLEPNTEAYNDTMALLDVQNMKREQWKLENERRRHNYVPLCMQLLKEIARLGDFDQKITQARERYESKKQKRE